MDIFTTKSILPINFFLFQQSAIATDIVQFFLIFRQLLHDVAPDFSSRIIDFNERELVPNLL